MKNNFLSALVLCTIFIICGSGPVNAQTTSTQKPFSFIENKGQVTDQHQQSRADIQFRLGAEPGLNIFIGAGAIHYQFVRDGKSGGRADKKEEKKILKHGKFQKTQSGIDTFYRMDMELVNANQNAEVIREEQQEYYENYYTLPVGLKGATVHSYNRIIYKNIYPNIDWVLYTKNGQLEHEFVVHEGGRPADIQLKYGGAARLNINENGSLCATTLMGVIREQAPASYQIDGSPVASRYMLDKETLTFETGPYKGELIIDPTLLWATYYGGSGDDLGGQVVTDNSGNVFMTGETSSTSNIATIGAYQIIGDSSLDDAFLAKFSGSDAIEWATYFGGDGDDGGAGIAWYSPGSVFITGWTSSTSNIATPGAYQTVYGGGNFDAFLAKFEGSGVIDWATYVGGTSKDLGEGVATDKSGNVFITGLTSSLSGITTVGAYQTLAGGEGDAFLAKFSSSGAIDWATYFGGSKEDDAYSAATDSLGNVLITGNTVSATNIATPGAYQITGDSVFGDVFLAKFSGGGAIDWATYFGGKRNEDGAGVIVDNSGSVFIDGLTWSTSNIATPGAYQTTGDSIRGDVFLAKFTDSGAINWATYFGGSGADQAVGVATDNTGNVFVTGATYSMSSIATPGAYQTMGDSINGNAFLAKFSGNGAIGWATYLGGSGVDAANGVATDNSGNVFISGNTGSTTNIATSGAYQTAYGGGYFDAFLAKFGSCSVPNVGAITGPVKVCNLATVTLSDTAAGGAWGSNNPLIATVAGGVVRAFTAGLDTIVYSLSNGCGTASAMYVITINALPVAAITASGNTAFCSGDSIVLSANTESNYLWNTSATTQSVTVKQSNTYQLTVTDNNGCTEVSNAVSITVYSSPAVSISKSGDTLTTGVASTYQWYFNGQPLAGDTSAAIIIQQAGNYSVQVTDGNGCGNSSSALYASPTGIEELSGTYSMRIFPNPGNGNFMLTFADDDPHTVQISDITGRLIGGELKVDRNANIDLSAEPSGIYLISVITNDTRFAQKLVVAR